MKYWQKGKYKSPEKRLTAVCKTISLLRFPIWVGRDPNIKYILFIITYCYANTIYYHSILYLFMI